MPARLAWLLVLAALFVVLPGLLWASGSGYYFRIAQLAMVFSILSVSLNFVCGTGGLLSLGHAAFYGIGAYAAALASTRWGFGFALTLPLAGIVAGAIGVLVALPTMRLVSIYFACATLGLGEIIYVTLLNWVSFTRGPMGGPGIPPMRLLGFDLSGPLASYYTVACVTAASVWCLHRLTHSYYGNALRALREDDQCAEAMGLDTVRLKIEVFAIACFFAGIAGALEAHTGNYISPDYFRFGESILILAMIVIGGLGSLPGAIVGAVLMILLPELLRVIGDFRMIAVGMFMFLSILFMPKGLFGEISALALARRTLGGAWTGAAAKVGWR